MGSDQRDVPSKQVDDERKRPMPVEELQKDVVLDNAVPKVTRVRGGKRFETSFPGGVPRQLEEDLPSPAATLQAPPKSLRIRSVLVVLRLGTRRCSSFPIR